MSTVNAFTAKPILPRDFISGLRRSAAASANGASTSRLRDSHGCVRTDIDISVVGRLPNDVVVDSMNTILRHLEEHGPQTSTELQARTRFSRSSVNNYLRNLAQQRRAHVLRYQGSGRALVWSAGEPV